MVYINEYMYMGNIAASIFAKINKKPIVLTQHMGRVPYSSPLINTVSILVTRTLGKYILENVDALVFYSEAVQQYFSRFCMFKSKPQHIPIGVDTDVFFR